MLKQFLTNLDQSLSFQDMAFDLLPNSGGLIFELFEATRYNQGASNEFLAKTLFLLLFAAFLMMFILWVFEKNSKLKK